jgi:class 3 adenylate cyclase/ketosteroid isomerase-like protein
MRAEPVTEREVMRVVRSMMSAFITLDPEDYMRHLVDDDALLVIGTGPNEVVHGHAAVREIIRAQLAELRGGNVRFLWDRVSQHGEVAWVSGEVSVKAELLDGTMSDFPTARYTTVLTQQNGQWRINTLHVSVADTTPTNGTWWPHTLDQLAVAVGLERPELRQQPSSDGMITLLFTDIEASSELNARLGDLRWMQVIREHNALVRERITAYGGTEVKTIGDAFMVAFGSARKAVLCAIDLQRAFAAYSRDNPESEVRIRIGLNAGEPVREDNDFFGRCVTEASRITSLANGGEILVSSLLRELVDAAGDLVFDGGRSVVLKGLSGERRVHSVLTR